MITLQKTQAVLLGSLALLMLAGCESSPEKSLENNVSENNVSENNAIVVQEKSSEIITPVVKKEEKKEMKQKEDFDPLLALVSPPSNIPVLYSLEEVSKHNTRDDCWTVVNGSVANVTSFFGIHPGGDDNLAKACGKDATKIFESVKKHDPKGYKKFKTFVVGKLQK